MYCQKCGSQIDDEAVVCPNCGCATSNMKSQEPPQVVINNTNTNTNTVVGGVGSPKSKTVALVLCFFLGEFGVHRFYVGKVGTGLIWLFTFGLCGIGWIVDFILILMGKFTDKFGFPLR